MVQRRMPRDMVENLLFLAQSCKKWGSIGVLDKRYCAGSDMVVNYD